ncbi:hypothetical protein NLU13_8530 [Sarocladium strictum]|uniref:Uncharacterized protein n=1 Tax=Sarocladium strictum TaxID=5046 RepID=A0AA39GDD3_SARSR|nr:hypothetical protein NLU13_8530 [Sarocladium strictum]
MAQSSSVPSSDDLPNEKIHLPAKQPEQDLLEGALPAEDPDSDSSHHGPRRSDDEETGSIRSVQTMSIASRIVSRITTRSSIPLTPPPDGGFAAWMVVIAGHLVIMCTWGVINSFGAFQAYYVSTLGRPPSDISWIGSFQVFLLFFIGTFTGRATDAGLLRPCLVTGIVLIALGAFSAAQCTQYWQLFLAQGVCLGLGNGFLFCPTIAVTSQYFQKNRALALGLSACGSATGGLIFPSMVRQLLPSIGFAWTMRSIGFIQVGCLIVAFMFLRPRMPPRKSGSLVDFASFKELDYTCYAIGSYLCFWGIYVPFFFLSSYARDIRGMAYASSLDLLLLMNGIGIVGRVLPSVVADKLGAVTMFLPMAASTALLMYCWPAVETIDGLWGWAAIYGITAGGIQSLFPSALSSLTLDPRKQGTRIGMTFTIVSFAVLTGPPIAGALISKFGYLAAQMFAGSSIALGAVSVWVSRETRRRRNGQKLFSKV